MLVKRPGLVPSACSAGHTAAVAICSVGSKAGYWSLLSSTVVQFSTVLQAKLLVAVTLQQLLYVEA